MSYIFGSVTFDNRNLYVVTVSQFRVEIGEEQSRLTRRCECAGNYLVTLCRQRVGTNRKA